MTSPRAWAGDRAYNRVDFAGPAQESSEGGGVV